MITIAAIAAFSASIFAQAQDKEAPRPQILFTDVKVFNGVDDKLHAVDVLVEGNLIKQVGKNLSVADATVIDGELRFLMPGIIEAHGHIGNSVPGDQLTGQRLALIHL